MIQQFDSSPVDTDSGPERVLTDSHIRALLPGSDCITSLNLCWSPGSRSALHLLANFGNLQQLELQLDEADGLRHLSGLKSLLELHLTIRTTNLTDCTCGDILENSQDSLLHVSLSAGAWDDKTYMALLCLSKLRTFSVKVHRLTPDNAKVLAQLRPSQSIHNLSQS